MVACRLYGETEAEPSDRWVTPRRRDPDGTSLCAIPGLGKPAVQGCKKPQRNPARLDGRYVERRANLICAGVKS